MALTTATLENIKLHYTEEYQKTLRKLKELQSVLEQLSHVDVSTVEIEHISVTVKDKKEKTAIANQEVIVAPTKRAYKKRNKKRGRKSVWGGFILKRLKAVNRPLTYNDLANHAIVTMNLPQDEFEKIRKTLIAAVFHLRNKQQKVETANKTGTRDKYVLLTKWTDESKNPLPEFQAYIE